MFEMRDGTFILCYNKNINQWKVKVHKQNLNDKEAFIKRYLWRRKKSV